MIDLARAHPARIVRSVRRTSIALARWFMGEPPQDHGRHIVARTLDQLAGRVAAPKLSVTFTDALAYRRDGVYRRDGKGYVLELPTLGVREDTIWKAWELGSAYLYWLMHCGPEVEFMSMTLSDGGAASAGRFAPSTHRSDVVPIPDPYFFRFAGFKHFRHLSESNTTAWADRSGDIVWRGASSGEGTFDPLIGAQQPIRAAQRLELVLAARKLPGVDAGLVNYLRDEFRREILVGAGLLKDPIPEESWAHRKFAIDVDGQTNTWSNLIVRMHLGCCVLKLDSKQGYRQWYYDRLKPWEHYVPVKADASDLGEQIEWVRSNDARAAQIAANAQHLARTLSFEAGRREAVELITTHWRD